jgi:hypothetical protein
VNPLESLTIPFRATSWIRNPSMPGRLFPGPDSETGFRRLTKGSRRPWAVYE